MGRRRPRLSVVSGITAMGLVAGGVLVGAPARAVSTLEPSGPALISFGNEKVLTFPVSSALASSSSDHLATQAAMSPRSFTTMALDVVNRNHVELGLTGSAIESRTLVSSDGERRVHLQQRIAGVPVMGGEAVVDLTQSGQARAVISDFLPGAAPANLVPALTSGQAFDFYRRSAARAGSRRAAPTVLSSTLTIYDPRIFGAPGVPRAQLVWRLLVHDSNPHSSTRTVLIDAQRGGVVLNISNDEKLANVTVCDDLSNPDSSNTIGCDVIHNGGTTLRAARLTDVPSGNAEVDAAYDNSVSTLQFYNDYLGRNSVNGRGQTLTSIVNFCPLPVANATTCPYENAYWDGQKILFGSGFAAADDVVAHEMSHGLTQNTAELFYYYQSGAINESLSDIFGEFVDQTDGHDVVGDSTSNFWQLGEDLSWVDSQGVTRTGPLRNMKSPSVFKQPDSTASALFGVHNPWDQDANGSLFDNGDVHLNSGVGNRFAYLLTDTSSANPGGVGIGKAAPIIFGAEQLLTSGADYRSFAAALRLSCSSWIGKTTPHGEVIGLPDCRQVDQAIKAVRMDAVPRGARAAAAICPSGRKVKVLWQDNMENPASGRWARSTAAGTHVTPALWYYGSQPVPFYGNIRIGHYATSGKNELWGDDPDPSDNYVSAGKKTYIFGTGKTFADHRESMTKNVVIPRGVPTYLRFNHTFGFDSFPTDSGVLNADGGLVEYSTDSGKTWLDARYLMSAVGNNGYNGHIDRWVDPGHPKSPSTNPVVSASKPTHAAFVGQSKGYESTRAVLTSLAGKNVRIRFRVAADQNTGEFGWAIDDVSFYSCPLA